MALARRNQCLGFAYDTDKISDAGIAEAMVMDIGASRDATGPCNFSSTGFLRFFSHYDSLEDSSLTSSRPQKSGLTLLFCFDYELTESVVNLNVIRRFSFRNCVGKDRSDGGAPGGIPTGLIKRPKLVVRHSSFYFSHPCESVSIRG